MNRRWPPKKDPADVRSKQVKFCLTEAEKHLLYGEASESSMSIPDFVVLMLGDWQRRKGGDDKGDNPPSS